MEPVEIDFIYGGNTQTEGGKIVMTLEQIGKASDEAKAKFERRTAAVVDLKKDLVGLGTAYKNATTKEKKSEILTEIELTKKNILDEKEALRQLKVEIASMGKMKPASVIPDAGGVAKTANQFNGLNTSVQQVVRELPAASMGLNMFFLAISNNLPIMADNIKRARLENEALKDSGASTTPVWKQLLSSLTSWQSLMMVGITIASMYGKQIFQAFSKGSEAAERAKEDTKKFNEAFAQSAADPLVKVNQLADRWNKLGDNLEEKKKFVDANKDAFRDLGVEVNNVKDAENLLVDNVDAFRQAMISKAMSVAAMQIATEKYKEYFKKMREAEKMAETYDVQESLGGGVYGGAVKTKTVKNQQKIDFVNTANQIKKEGDALISESGKQNDAYLAFLEKAGIKRTNKEKKIRERTHSIAYNSESDFLKLIFDLTEKSESMLIDQKEDSLAKRLAVIQQEKDKELEAIKEKEIAIIESYNRSQKKQVDEYNRTHKDKKTFRALSTKTEDISVSLVTINPKQAKELADATLEIESAFTAKLTSETEKWQKEMLALGVKYGDEQTKIRVEYDERIKKLAQNGFIIQAADLQKERDEKISAIEAGLMKETSLYQIATDSQLRISKDLSEKLIAEIKRRIEADDKLTRDDKDKLLLKLNESDGVKAINAIDGIIKSLSGLKKAKKDAANAIAVGDVEGATDAASKISDFQSALKKYGDEVLNYFDQASSGIIGIMDQLGAFTESEKKDAENIVGMVSGAGDLAVGIASGNVGQIISGTISLVTNAIEYFDFKSKNIEKAQKRAKQNLEDLARAYNKLQRAVDDALGTDVYAAQRKQVDNLREQIIENQRLISEELKKTKKKQDANAITEWQDKIDELNGQIKDITDTITESIAQTNVKDLATQLSDALVTAFQNGESAAMAMGNVVDDVLRTAVINALKLKVLDKLLAPAIDQFAADMQSGDGLTDSEAGRFRKSVTDAGEAYFKALNEANDALGGIFTGDTSGAASGIKGDVAKMTEETGSALVGQITAMRLNIAALLATDKDAIDIMAKQLAVLSEIRTFTSRLDRIDDTLYYFKLNGIKVA